MIKKLLAFLFVSLVVGGSCLHASAETEITPSDSWSYESTLTMDNIDYFLETDSLGQTLSVQASPWLAGSSWKEANVRIAFEAPYATSIPGTGASDIATFQSNYIPNGITYISAAQASNYHIAFGASQIEIDTTLLTPGVYHYTADIYIGSSWYCSWLTSAGLYQPSFTLNDNSVSQGYFTMEYFGTTSYDFTYGGFTYTSNMPHYHIDYYFEVFEDQEQEFINFGAALQAIGGQVLYYDMGNFNIRKYGYVSIFTNNRFESHLYADSAFPVEPSPTPTPYPGQDTQESINAGVQIIVNALDLSATPIPTPADLEIDESILETMTLPDVSSTQDTFTSLWDIFDPLWSFLALLAGSLLVVGIFCYILRGGFI